ncbi:hypothetical protein [Paracoccus sp. Ld10]|uniref:hypothetical protein n=1 Tax=Paracoccus sp. Ld10 TaxID=649158 RepID=UPI00386AE741
MTPASRTTGAVTALLVFLGIGLFGQMGWLAALVLAVIAGGMLALTVGWLSDPGSAAMDGSDWDAMPVQPAGQTPRAMARPRENDAPAVARPLATGSKLEGPDDLRAIKGIGPKVQQSLEQAGVTRFSQIAAWDDADVDRMADVIGRAASHIRNDDWVGQARVLAALPQEAG